MRSIDVRAATREDIPRIAEIHVAGWEAAYRGMIPDEALDVRTVEHRTAQWRELFDGSEKMTDHSVYVLELDGTVSGFAHVGPSDDEDVDRSKTFNIYALYLEPALRGRGLGQSLLDHVVASAAADGYTLATLYVMENNDPAIHFYEKLGWTAERHVVKECLGDGLHAPQFRFQRALT